MTGWGEKGDIHFFSTGAGIFKGQCFDILSYKDTEFLQKNHACPILKRQYVRDRSGQGKQLHY